jgi:hypothetical protein
MKQQAMNLLISTIALALGIFAAVSPAQATKLWGWKQISQLDPRDRILYLRWYRAFGISLGLSGALLALGDIFDWR